MPRGRHGALVSDNKALMAIDPLDPEVWEENHWGLADPGQIEALRKLLPDKTDQERRAIALDHQRKCLLRARLFHAALDVPAAPPAGTELSLFAGDAVDTPSVFSAADRKVLLWAAGDGTVLRSSALMDERVGQEWQSHLVSPIRWSQATFLFRDHLGVTKDPHFTDNVLYQLLESPR
ncbi:MAG: hypothetical protein ACYTGZ_16395 [Planctomycetota bacterium]|jgi:hypothetical protein